MASEKNLTYMESVDRIAELKAKLAEANDSLEQERVRLAGCLVVAEGHDADCKQGDYGWSPALEAAREVRKKLAEARGKMGGEE